MEDMGVLATDDHQLTLVYTSESSIGKQALGYVQGADDKIQTIDISKTNLGDTVWVSIADGLKVPLHQLFSKDHPDAPKVEDAEFDTDDWLKLIKNNPALLQKPVAIKGKKFMQVDTPSEVLKFFGVESAGLEKENVGEPPTTSSKTDGEEFV